jgi:hypothetical protein
MIGISCTASLTNSWPSSVPLGSSNEMARICSMILSRSGFDQRDQLRGVCTSPAGFTNSECQLSRKKLRSGCPPQVSTLQEIATSKSPPLRRVKNAACAESVVASTPKRRHCSAIIEPARVITGRASPSTITVTLKRSPFGMYQSLPWRVKPARSSSSAAAVRSCFHQPSPKAAPISSSVVGIWSPTVGRSISAICLVTVPS